MQPTVSDGSEVLHRAASVGPFEPTVRHTLTVATTAHKHHQQPLVPGKRQGVAPAKTAQREAPPHSPCSACGLTSPACFRPVPVDATIPAFSNSVFSLPRCCCCCFFSPSSSSLISSPEAIQSPHIRHIQDAGSPCFPGSCPQARPPRGASRGCILVGFRRLYHPRPIRLCSSLTVFQSPSTGSTLPVVTVSPSTREPRTHR